MLGQLHIPAIPLPSAVTREEHMARDATFKKSAPNGSFHDPDNWEEGYVPDGVATIPDGVNYVPYITFGRPLTVFSAFRSLSAGFMIAAGETVKVEGVTMPKGHY